MPLFLLAVFLFSAVLPFLVVCKRDDFLTSLTLRSSFFRWSAMSEDALLFLRFAHNGCLRFSSGSNLCRLFRPYFDVVSKCIERLKEDEGSHMSSAGP